MAVQKRHAGYSGVATSNACLEELRAWADAAAKEVELARAAAEAGAEPEAEALAEELYACNELRGVLAQLLSTQSDDVRKERFASTPADLYEQMATAVRAREEPEAAMAAWVRGRVRRAAAQASREQAEAAGGEPPCAASSKDASGHVDADVGEMPDRGDEPQPDGFISVSTRLPKGHALATAHAEAVLLDRVRAVLDRHYDDVFVTEWLARRAKDSEAVVVPRRPRAHRLEGRVLEAWSEKRYEVFRLPDAVRELLRRPSDENDWAKAVSLRDIVLDLADGVQEIRCSTSEALEAVRAALTKPMGEEAQSAQSLRCSVEVAEHFLPAGTRVLTDATTARAPVALRTQKPSWRAAPLSPFGEALRREHLAARSPSLRQIAAKWEEPGVGPEPLSVHAVVTRLLLDLGFCLWRMQVAE